MSIRIIFFDLVFFSDKLKDIYYSIQKNLNELGAMSMN